MGFFNEFPHTRTYDNDLGWLIKTIKELEINLQNFIKLNTVKYADPIQWNISTQYESNTVVIDALTGVAYISTQPVPSGVNINNTDYWTPVFTLDLVNLNKNITLRNDGDNHNATFASVIGDWVIVGGQLYKVIQDIALYTAYVVGYNIEIYTVELFVKDYITSLANIIGDLTDLSTSNKTSIVNAINEIVANIGDLNDLDTTDKDSVVDALNELAGNIGDLSDLDTTNKDSVVDALNELAGNIGDLSDLDTTDKDSVVDAINETVSNINNLKNYVTPKMFGAIGDGVTDDTAAIQAAIDYAYANHITFKGDAVTYLITTTLYLPIQDALQPPILIDFNGSTLKAASDIIVLTSAYKSGDVYITNFGTADDTYMNFGTTLKNLLIDVVSNEITDAIRLQDWHQFCVIENIYSHYCKTLIHTKNCYYTSFEKIFNMYYDQYSGSSGMIFESSNNLCTFKNLVSTNHDVGYTIGACNGAIFDNISVEGDKVGMKFTGTETSIEIRSCYLENCINTFIEFDSYVLGVKITSCYFNYLNIDNVTGISTSDVPGIDLVIDETNYFVNITGSSKKFSGSSTEAYSRWIVREAPETYDVYKLLNQEIPVGAEIDKVLHGTGLSARVVNRNGYIPGYYSGKFANGLNGSWGFEDQSPKLSTRMFYDVTQLILVNVYVYGGNLAGYLHGFIFGDTFYRFTSSGLSVPTEVTVSYDVNGFVEITITGMTACRGNIRLI